MNQADVITAYLNAQMDDEVYIKLPKVCGDYNNYVWRLFKALYGHPKAGQLWNMKFVAFMIAEHFKQSVRDKCFLLPTWQVYLSNFVCR